MAVGIWLRSRRPMRSSITFPGSAAGVTVIFGAASMSGRARQVFDLPEIRLSVVEHRAWTRRCACGHETSSTFPDTIAAAAQYGPRVWALGLYLVAHQHLPYDRAAQLSSDWIGQAVSTGTLAAFMTQKAARLR
jgi:transposase